MSIQLPQWLYDTEITSGCGAYEGLSPLLRAHLKAQISFLHEVWKTESSLEGVMKRSQTGAYFIAERKAVDWALFLISETYASPAGFIAALLPALMSGVESVFIVRVGNSQDDLHPSISAAMELLGREDIFTATDSDVVLLVEDLTRQSAFGRAVGLGCYFPQVHTLPANLKFGLDNGNELSLDVLSWLYPDAVFEAVQAGKEYDALISSAVAFTSQGTGQATPSLILSPEQAHCWFWPSLEPAYFQHKVIQVR